jgi:hypothetical protein
VVFRPTGTPKDLHWNLATSARNVSILEWLPQTPPVREIPKHGPANPRQSTFIDADRPHKGAGLNDALGRNLARGFRPQVVPPKLCDVGAEPVDFGPTPTSPHSNFENLSTGLPVIAKARLLRFPTL